MPFQNTCSHFVDELCSACFLCFCRLFTLASVDFKGCCGFEIGPSAVGVTFSWGRVRLGSSAVGVKFSWGRISVAVKISCGRVLSDEVPKRKEWFGSSVPHLFVCCGRGRRSLSRVP